ncbi:retrovirus-related pol polyprotein from transposon TNT 1-94 [Tanacetum coccineum]
MDATDYSNLTKPNQKDQVMLEDSLENLANKSLVAKHGLSSETTQSLGVSSDTSEGSKNSRSFEDSGRSDEEDSEDEAFFEEGGSENLQVRSSTRESRAPVRYSSSVNYLLLTENGELESYSDALNYQHERRHYRASRFSGSKKSRMAAKGTGLDWWLRVSNRCRIWEGGKDTKDTIDHCCYLKKVGSFSIIILLYVDDMLVVGSDMEEIKKLKRRLSQEFEMKDLGSAKPDIAHAVGVVSRLMPNPGREHWEVFKWLLHYLKGTSKATLCFSRLEAVLEGFSDSDYGDCLDSVKSTTGYVFTMGGITVSWMSRIQKCVVMSTIEADYMAIAEAGMIEEFS